MHVRGEGSQTLYFNDVHVFDTGTNAWSVLSSSGSRPTGRCFHAMTEAEGIIYVHGGFAISGNLKNTLWSDFASMNRPSLPERVIYVAQPDVF
jgi:N-acetylneuraminic acid mutarotase